MKNNNKNVDFRQRKLVFMDFEMTGLDVEIHEITEAACLVVDWNTLKIEKEFYAKIKPQHPETAIKKALKIGGYKEEEWKKARSGNVVFREINRLSPGGIPAGWCTHSDYRFLLKEFKRYRIRSNFDYHIFDVVTQAYLKLFNVKNVKELSLRKISKTLGIQIPEKHDAMSDIKGTYEVFLKLMEK